MTLGLKSRGIQGHLVYYGKGLSNKFQFSKSFSREVDPGLDWPHLPELDPDSQPKIQKKSSFISNQYFHIKTSSRPGTHTIGAKGKM